MEHLTLFCRSRLGLCPFKTSATSTNAGFAFVVASPRKGCLKLEVHPLAWLLSAPNVCGGAQRVISPATGFFTGESRRKPIRRRHPIKYQYISYLHDHDLGLLDSFSKSTKSSLPNPPGQIHLAKSSPPNTLKMAVWSEMGGRSRRARSGFYWPTDRGPKSAAHIGRGANVRPAASSADGRDVAIGKAAAAAAERGKCRWRRPNKVCTSATALMWLDPCASPNNNGPDEADAPAAKE